jgi:hypothetical protein
MWLIGCGFPGTTLLLSSRAKPRAFESSPRRIGKLWPSGSTSLQSNQVVRFRSDTDAFKKVVMPARATFRGGALSLPINSGWAGKDINIEDQVEVALAGRLQMSALAHVAGSTFRIYVGPCNAFVLWCGTLMRPRRPLPADDHTVALYIFSISHK